MVGRGGQGFLPIRRSRATAGPGVRNVEPDLSATLERPEPPGSRVLNPGFQASSLSVNQSRLHPRTPGVNQNGPRPRPDAGRHPPASAGLRPCRAPAPPRAAESLFPVGRSPGRPPAPAAPLPTHRPPTQRPRGRPEQGEPGCGAEAGQTGRATWAWRFRPPGGRQRPDGTRRGLPAVTRSG